MNLVEEKQRGPIPTGLKGWPLKLIKLFPDTTCVTNQSDLKVFPQNIASSVQFF